MMCTKCSKSRATIHIIDIKPEGLRDLHVCEECAKKHGLIVGLDDNNLDELLKMIGGDRVVEGSEEELQENDDSPECPQCGFSVKGLSRSSRFGCEEDVVLFRDEIKPLLMRIHGATKHCGRSATFSNENARKQQTLQALENQLSDALKAEDYELAAVLRDKIKDIK